MLQLRNILDPQGMEIEFDFYVPIKISLSNLEDLIQPSTYWRTGDLKNSLIEVGVGKEDGKFHSLIVVLAINVKKKRYTNYAR